MRIYIKVIPKSSQNKVEKISEGEYKAWLNAPPVDGKANQALVELLADYFDISKSQVQIIGSSHFGTEKRAADATPKIKLIRNQKNIVELLGRLFMPPA